MGSGENGNSAAQASNLQKTMQRCRNILRLYGLLDIILSIAFAMILIFGVPPSPNHWLFLMELPHVVTGILALLLSWFRVNKMDATVMFTAAKASSLQGPHKDRAHTSTRKWLIFGLCLYAVAAVLDFISLCFRLAIIIRCFRDDHQPIDVDDDLWHMPTNCLGFMPFDVVFFFILLLLMYFSAVLCFHVSFILTNGQKLNSMFASLYSSSSAADRRL